MKIKKIDITALEWFDQKNANSYFSATVLLNYGMEDQKEITLPFQYGYEDHYIDVANQELIKQGYRPGERNNNGSFPALWLYCQENNIILRTVKHENCKKRELINI